MGVSTPPFPAPIGFRWICTTHFTHWRSKKVIEAKNYGKKCFFFLARLKKR